MNTAPYIEADNIALVAEFHATFKHPILHSPTVPEKKRQELRVELIASELRELQQAFEAKDKVKILDALCDLQYVLSGTILECGMALEFAEAFEEVHRSNMSKACNSPEEALATINKYKDGMGEDSCEAYYAKVGDKYMVYRKSDDKTLKSINYSPADLAQFVQ